MHSDLLEVWEDGGREGEDGLHIHPLRDEEGVLGEGREVRTNTAAFVDPNIEKR
jgi:hypothetical protein